MGRAVMGPISIALTVVRELTTAPYGLTLQDLAGRMRRPASTVQRVTRILEEQNLVVRTAHGRAFLLGPATRALAQQICTASSDLAGSDLDPILTQTATRTGETVLVVRATESGAATVVAAAPSPQPLRVHLSAGTSLSLTESTAGRVLLAWQERPEIHTALTAAPLAPEPVALLKLFDRLRIIREHGFDTGTGELDTDIWTVSAPIRSSTSTTVTGSVTIAAPDTRAAAPRHRDEATAAALETATALAAKLNSQSGSS